jgi:hypothetical protein
MCVRLDFQVTDGPNIKGYVCEASFPAGNFEAVLHGASSAKPAFVLKPPALRLTPPRPGRVGKSRGGRGRGRGRATSFAGPDSDGPGDGMLHEIRAITRRIIDQMNGIDVEDYDFDLEGELERQLELDPVFQFDSRNLEADEDALVVRALGDGAAPEVGDPHKYRHCSFASPSFECSLRQT